MRKIGWNEPRFGKEEIEAISKPILNNYVNEGPLTKELEDKLRNFLGVNHVIIATNGTAALYLALKADKEIRGYDNFEVIVPDMTMFASATAVGWAGGKPILADVNADRMTLNLKDVERKITSRTKAIMPVHILGRSADMNSLENIAKKNDLILVEDAAGALASKDESGRYLGTIGKVGCYSLQSNKIITTGQGGVVATNDLEYFNMMRRIRDFGRVNNKEFTHMKEGYNLKFNDLSAALGLAQFDKLADKREDLIRQREQYRKELSSVLDVNFPIYREGEVPLWVDAEVSNRNSLSEYLKSNGISTRDCWPAIHRNPPYADQGNDKDFPNASHISDNVIWLPNGPGVTKEDISYVCEHIREFYEK